jgi:hypothetical protein
MMYDSVLFWWAASNAVDAIRFELVYFDIKSFFWKFLKIPVKIMENSGNLRIDNPYKP